MIRSARSRWPSRWVGGLLFLVALPGHAMLGIFEHGNGIVSLGMGGLGYAIGQESTALSANPAHSGALGNRVDLGVNGFFPPAEVEFSGNGAGPDSQHRNTGRRYFAIPQGGFNRTLSPRWSIGMTAFSAGMGPDYRRNPYARFGGDARASLFLSSAGIATVLGYRLNDDHLLGASLNLGYQSLAVKGIGALGAVSRTPEKVSNQGKDASASVGFSVGWLGQLTPRLMAGLSYRSKAWTEKHDDYRGLLPNQGQLELPQIWGGGLAYELHPSWRVGFDFQRYHYSSQVGFGNRIARLDPQNGLLLGDDEGAGFGFRNQNVYKFGVEWTAIPRWALRAGFIDAMQAVSSSETLFAMFGPTTCTEHYTLGATRAGDAWDVSGFASWSPQKWVRGRDSIPDLFGGGEASVSVEVFSIGFTLARRFGGPDRRL